MHLSLFGQKICGKIEADSVIVFIYKMIHQYMKHLEACIVTYMQDIFLHITNHGWNTTHYISIATYQKCVRDTSEPLPSLSFLIPLVKK